MSTDQQNFNANPQMPNQQPEPQDSAPWWHKPWVWGILGALLILFGYLIGSCVRSDTTSGSAYDTRQEELMLMSQHGLNDGLQSEIDRLRGLLAGDVCVETRTEPLYDKPLPEDTVPGQAAPPPEGAPIPAEPEGPSTYNMPTTNSTVEPLEDSEDMQKPETLAALAEQATVLVLALADENSASMGTGFFYAPGLILTNAHVVNGYKELYVINKALGKLVQGEVVAYGRNASDDLAIIKVGDPAVATIYPLTFTTKVARTDRVGAWGFPGLITATDPKLAALLEGDQTAAPEIVYSEGVVSMIVDDNPQIIVHTAEISQGNSGGPTIDKNGRVVGINTWIMPDDKSNRQANLCLGTRDILAFLARHNSGAVVEE